MVKLRLFFLAFAGLLIGVYCNHRFHAQIIAEVQGKPLYPILTVGDESPAVLTLHEKLADLEYLPVHFQPFSSAEHVSLTDVFSPSAGIWTWRFHNIPAQLVSEWNPTKYSMITKGAVMTFQKEHQLTIDGFAGPKVFRALEIARIAGMVCRHPYTNVIVKQTIPQTLTIWQEGKLVLKSPCSTGVSKAPTHTGTYAIYLRNIRQKMEGDTPWGTHYRVEDVPFVSYFFNGEAIHGLKRQIYGIPQSVGCVELPVSFAKRVWTLTDYGTIVTILNP